MLLRNCTLCRRAHRKESCHTKVAKKHNLCYSFNMQELKRFPIGVQDFERLRNDGKYYVDKTDLVYKMTHTDDYYFLSRPRRFVKSLLVSTLKC